MYNLILIFYVFDDVTFLAVYATISKMIKKKLLINYKNYSTFFKKKTVLYS